VAFEQDFHPILYNLSRPLIERQRRAAFVGEAVLEFQPLAIPDPLGRQQAVVFGCYFATVPKRQSQSVFSK
jgi:hypothetical protein